MPKRNPKSPWNPANPTEISPKEYEKQVIAWLQATKGTLDKFEVKHRRHLRGAGGDYEFDAVAQYTILNGAQIIVLVECKRYSKPIERKELLSLWAKTQDVKAHKAMIFATCSFQSGALEFAKTYGIATVTFVEGTSRYETRNAGPFGPPPSLIGMPDYVGGNTGAREIQGPALKITIKPKRKKGRRESVVWLWIQRSMILFVLDFTNMVRCIALYRIHFPLNIDY